jgi:N-acetyl-anhydromuramyl-L-alanine amidase AmpD
VKVSEIVIHHTASPRDTTKLADIRRWHVLENRWSDVGYHYIIEGDGTLRVGRPAHLVGAHVLGFNSNVWKRTYTLGICLAGNFQNEQPSAAQLKTLVQLLAVLCRRHGLSVASIKGHRDFQPNECPGRNLYALFPRIRADVAPYLAA